MSLSLWLGVFAQGQQQSAEPIPPMPPGPPIEARAADHTQWIITATESMPSTTSTSPAPAGGAPKKTAAVTTVTKADKIIRRVVVYDQSQPWETWCAGDLQITLYPDGKTLTQPRPIDVGFPNPFYVDYSRSDFPEFWWVSSKNYAGIKSQAGKSCLYFKDHLKLYGDDTTESDLEAYVEVKTHYPVLLIANASSKSYTFSSFPGELKLPGSILAVLKERAKTTATATRTLPKLAP